MTSEPRQEYVLALIPARGGSKGIPRKNLQLLAGRPLLHYTFDAARGSRYVDRIIVSTDCEEIARVAREAEIEVPFMRPAELAADEAPTLGVVQHALDWLKQHSEAPDIVVLLQPTAPLRCARDIDEALCLLGESGADSVVSVSPAPAHFHPAWQFEISGGELRCADGSPLDRVPTRRQDLPTTWVRNGAIYAFRRSALERTGALFGERCMAMKMPLSRSVNIDTLEDWHDAEMQLKDTGR